ncbi:3-hydroxyanthranilate 3,4-dioxygenase [Microbulbifer marinus]|uniref:3-hydroxyanthranilate 3,4-dioxygenase n=1 Tax=Microbulbifer marinus TaxID=658218 RepID=A0A1H4ABG3_9GAMM|nr:3-hydroxyanthranilate 3,4-dioxygenase [Microbulbifer marinus]SEA33098.1 3-hydroxyanthranilate 3,4-dioxygenase [Microbulbifer marinus]
MTNIMPPINFHKWIEEHRELLKPPVCNKLVFEEQGFFVMVVGGPNTRKDYHVDEGPELFYQVEGDMLLKTIQQGKVVDIPIREGEMFLLPPRVPHSPQRFENTVGLVVERRRTEDELDGLQWYCDQCNHLLYEEFFKLRNIEKDFPPVFDRFFGSEDNRCCDACGHVMPLPGETSHSKSETC